MRRFRSLFVAIGLVAPLFAMIGVSPAHAAGPGYNVFVGYADNLRSGTTQSPTPWEGSPGVIFEGCTPGSSCTFDAGAIRVANATAVTETVDFVTVDFGGCVFDLWPHNVSLPSGGQLILTQTASGAGDGCPVGTTTGPSTMDSSDFGPGGAPWAGQCSQSGVIPQVTVSVNGTATTYADSGQVLNTSGVDAADCGRPGFPAGNESTQWVSIGAAPCPTGAVLSLAPPTQNDVVGSIATVTANFSACGSPLQGATVNFAVVSGPNTGAPGSGPAVTDANGNASFSYSSSVTGTDTLQAAVTNLAGTISSNTVTVTWDKRPTTLTYNGAVTSDFNDAAVLSATLADATSGSPVAGESVTFSLNGAETCTGTTDATGKASCSVTPGEAAGAYPVTASFAGDATHFGSTTSAGFTVTREESALSSTTALQLFSAGGVASLSSTLTDPDGGAPIAGKAVTMTLGSGSGAQSCTAPTNASGIATCSISPVTVALGPQAVTDSFGGDAFYRPTSNGQQAMVFAFGKGGSFVIGDRSANGSVTFWGAQWSKANRLSGGDAPASFKGFENTPAPACGTTWTADPGNSTPPPAGPLPAYTAVVVASQITKSGSTISGNTVHIVIVRTDPGYQADPGHPGTGTVVATVC